MKVLGTAEEEEDAVAAQQAKAEQELEMVEFSENVNNEINEKVFLRHWHYSISVILNILNIFSHLWGRGK